MGAARRYPVARANQGQDTVVRPAIQERRHSLLDPVEWHMQPIRYHGDCRSPDRPGVHAWNAREYDGRRFSQARPCIWLSLEAKCLVGHFSGKELYSTQPRGREW